MVADYVNDQIDVATRTFLGLTVACARCHDHKFDPISTEDYYSLAGIFFSTRLIPSPVPSNTPLVRAALLPKAEVERIEAAKKRAAELKPELTAAEKKIELSNLELSQSLWPETARYLMAVWEYQNRPPDQIGISLADFAADKDLHTYAMRNWIDYLNLGPQPEKQPDLPPKGSALAAWQEAVNQFGAGTADRNQIETEAQAVEEAILAVKDQLARLVIRGEPKSTTRKAPSPHIHPLSSSLFLIP